jgi:curved DNA-binding protein CbpA
MTDPDQQDRAPDANPMEPAPADPYRVLGVARGASDAAIAAAHRDLARKFHPDIAGDGATAQMTRINAAFDTIRTAQRRADYDDLAPRDDRSATPEGPSADHAIRTPWTSGRSGEGGAGAPPGRPSGSVLGFGRHIGWSIGEIARVDPGYLEWLALQREGRPYLGEIEDTLRRAGYRSDTSATKQRR